MFGVCEYCGDSDCWGHTNDEKSAMDEAKRHKENASSYWKRITQLESALREAREALESLRCIGDTETMKSTTHDGETEYWVNEALVQMTCDEALAKIDEVLK